MLWWRGSSILAVLFLVLTPAAGMAADTDSSGAVFRPVTEPEAEAVSEELERSTAGENGVDSEASGVIFQPVLESAETGILEEAEGVAGSDFGPRRRNFHPFVSAGSYFTTNLFNIENDESELVYYVAPGIWVALPGSRQPLLQVETLNTAPGGLELTRFRDRDERRFRAFALYRGEFTEHERFQDAETDDHRLEALLRYNAPGGLWAELLDIYEDDHDAFSTGDAPSRQLQTFKANLLSPAVGYRVSPKLSLRLDYNWYVLDYDSRERSFRDREDHVISSYVFYRLSGKTTTFVEYEHAQIEYDNDPERDNSENRVFAGMQWQMTGKSKGRLKAGYGKKDYDVEGPNDERDSFMTEIRLDHRFSPKTSVDLKLLRRIHESDVQGVRNALVHRVNLGYRQELTGKITAKAELFYHNVDYSGVIVTSTRTGRREDDRYGVEIAAGYALKRWLNISTGYVFSERDSNFNDRDYSKHTVFLNFTVAL